MSEVKEHKSSLDDIDDGGAFKRKPTQFRNKITVDGSSGFKAEAGRYHLYVSLACPWAHRTLITRALKGLENVISVSIVNSFMGDNGWTFDKSDDGLVSDEVNHAKILREVYLKANPDYDGRITVPVLWDKQKNTIVNNESAEIIRMLNTEFNAFATNPTLDLYPADLQKKIDEMNEFVYPNINDGVYKCGFAKTQAAYEDAFDKLFAALDKLEELFTKQRYLVGSQITEADVRLFTTLIRFDAVYTGHFKCNKKQLREYPAILGFTRELYQNPTVKATVNFQHIKHHYYYSHVSINPTRVVPKGPDNTYLEVPHNRDKIRA
jgi:putative glutathione S-transferase